jgi:hypothetical protein
VAPPISLASLKPYRPPPRTPQPAVVNPAPVFAPHPTGTVPPTMPIIRPSNMSSMAQRRRAIRAHNKRMRARAIKEQRDSQ